MTRPTEYSDYRAWKRSPESELHERDEVERYRNYREEALQAKPDTQDIRDAEEPPSLTVTMRQWEEEDVFGA